LTDLFATELERRTGAVFSPCRRWRYLLWRIWDATKPHATFCMMNGSRPTSRRRCDRRPLLPAREDLARDRLLDVGGIKVVNAFGWVETDSTQLKALIDAGVDLIGPENDRYILEACKGAAIVVCGWGEPGHKLLGRGPKLLELMRANGIRPHALKINASGARSTRSTSGTTSCRCRCEAADVHRQKRGREGTSEPHADSAHARHGARVMRIVRARVLQKVCRDQTKRPHVLFAGMPWAGNENPPLLPLQGVPRSHVRAAGPFQPDYVL
jgi:hypothetical protein